MKYLYLLQRIKIQKNKFGTNSIDLLFVYDYMGSAEFEFGALRKSYKEILTNFDNYCISDMGFTTHDSCKFYSICPENIKDCYSKHFYQVTVNLKDKGLKEPSRVQYRVSGKDYFGDRKLTESSIAYFDTWWDIENHVIVSTGQKNINEIFRLILNEKQKLDNSKEN